MTSSTVPSVAPRDETIIAALKARVLEAALAGNTRTAGELTRIADILHRHLVEEKKLALAERHLQLIEQEKAGEMKNLREELDAAQEELKRSKKVSLVWNLHGGLPILPSRTDNEGTVSTEETEPASYPATSPRVPPPAAPPDDPY